ncbi:MAG: SHOCT domain-containing protein [Gaiellaceae bacterium]
MNIFLWFVIWILLLIMILSDNFRCNDHSGSAEVFWTLFVICTPLIGVLAYMLVRPKMTDQDKELIDQYQEQQRRFAGTPADEIGKLHELKEAAAISTEEYEAMKAKALA